MFRIYDKKNQVFVTSDNIMVNQDGYLYKNEPTKNILIFLDNDSRYIKQEGIGIVDGDGCYIFVGDIVRIILDDKNNTRINKFGVVSYIPQLATYMVIDHKDKTCYPIRANKNEIADNICIIGTIFDNKIEDWLFNNEFKDCSFKKQKNKESDYKIFEDKNCHQKIIKLLNDTKTLKVKMDYCFE